MNNWQIYLYHYLPWIGVVLYYSRLEYRITADKQKYTAACSFAFFPYANVVIGTYYAITHFFKFYGNYHKHPFYIERMNNLGVPYMGYFYTEEELEAWTDKIYRQLNDIETRCRIAYDALRVFRKPSNEADLGFSLMSSTRRDISAKLRYAKKQKEVEQLQERANKLITSCNNFVSFVNKEGTAPRLTKQLVIKEKFQ